ncbi:ANTH domain-containing protein [Myxozyma melibiosi]|uniref:ANTH domain-containing protein n=1 Tax=Myxozyma melibiosi TaxID=54550 RepID=A0ABR1EY65_9ASCO
MAHRGLFNAERFQEGPLTNDLRFGAQTQMQTQTQTQTSQEQLYALTNAIKKATLKDDLAPKAKHVDYCVEYTWRNETALYFWSQIKAQSTGAKGNSVRIFKALALAHRVMQDGHPTARSMAPRYLDWFVGISEDERAQKGAGVEMAGLVREYAGCLAEKVRLHSRYAGFDGLLREIEGTPTLSSAQNYSLALDLQNMHSQFSKFFSNLLTQISADRSAKSLDPSLLCVIKETAGVQRLATSVLRSVYREGGEYDLAALRVKYEEQHRELRELLALCLQQSLFTQEIESLEFAETPPDVQEEALPAYERVPEYHDQHDPPAYDGR